VLELELRVAQSCCGSSAVPNCRHVNDFVQVCDLGSIKIGDEMKCSVRQVDCERRRKTLANHSATHILDLGLRKVRGEADQKVM